jgi:hypothetical protein
VTLIPELLAVTGALTVKLQLTPLNICGLLALVFCMAVVWKWAKGKI